MLEQKRNIIKENIKRQLKHVLGNGLPMLTEHRISVSPAYCPPSRAIPCGPAKPGLHAPRVARSQPRTTAGVANLRAEIDRIERQSLDITHDDRVVDFGEPVIDQALPWGGLPRGVLHEVVAGDCGAGIGFIAAILGRMAALDYNRDKQILWCLPPTGLYETGNLYTPGLAAYGIDPERLLLARGRRDADIQWTMEEGLQCAGLMAVVGEVRGLDLTASRRLQLAARRSGVTVFFLMSGDQQGKSRHEPSAAVTRWRVTSAAAEIPARGSLHSMAWELELVRCRAGLPKQWRVGFDTRGETDYVGKGVPHAPGRFRVAATVCDRPLESARSTPKSTPSRPASNQSEVAVSTALSTALSA